MTAAPVLRPAVPSDAAALARLHATGFDAPWSEADFTGWLARADAFAVVAEISGETAGFGLALVAGDDAEILTIAVRPDCRSHGLGGALIDTLDHEALRRGLARWVLEVSRNNLPALRLYTRQGFVEIGVRKQYYRTPDGLVDALMLARPTGRSGGHAGA